MAGFFHHIRGSGLFAVATLSFYEKEPVLRKKQNERRSERKAEGEEERRSKRSELASGVKFKFKANYRIPAGIFGGFRGVFRGVVLHRGILSGRYFLLCKTHFTCDGLYLGANIRGEFIGCVSGELQFGAFDCAGDSNAEVRDEKAMRDAGDGHTAFISLTRIRPRCAFPDVFLWFGTCADGSVFDRCGRRCGAIYNMVLHRLQGFI